MTAPLRVISEFKIITKSCIRLSMLSHARARPHGEGSHGYSLHYDHWRSASMRGKAWILLGATGATDYRMSFL
jgi:hypothetical protein